MASNVEEAIGVSSAPFLEYVAVKQHEVFRDLCFARQLFVFVYAHASNFCDKSHGGGEMLRRERQAVRVQIVNRQVAIRLNNDWPGGWLYRPRVDLVRQSFLDDDGVVIKSFRLRKQIADSDTLTSAAHS